MNVVLKIDIHVNLFEHMDPIELYFHYVNLQLAVCLSIEEIEDLRVFDENINEHVQVINLSYDKNIYPR